MNDKIHKFEEAGLGKAPFVCVGDFEAQPCKVCDYCGRSIRVVFVVRSSDGKEFFVGSDCVFKTGDAGLKARVNQQKREARQEKLEAIRQQEWEARKNDVLKKLAEVESEFERVKPTLQSRPHPNAYFASQGKTMLDYVLYMRGAIEDTFHPEVKLEAWYKSKVLSALIDAGAKL